MKVWYEVEVKFREADWKQPYLRGKYNTPAEARKTFQKANHIKHRIVKVTETREVVE